MEKRKMVVIYIIKVQYEGAVAGGSLLVARSVNEVIKTWIDAVLSTLGSEITGIHHGQIDVTGLSDGDALKSCANCKLEAMLKQG